MISPPQSCPYVSWNPRLHNRFITRALLSPALTPPLDGPRVQFYHRGANAIWCGLGALRWGSGDKILFPAYHCGTELDAILRRQIAVHLYPVSDELVPDLGYIRGAIDQDTRALFVIHYFGFPQNLDDIAALCREFGLLLIEDCAHSLYSTIGGRPTGSTGDIAFFSFRKTLPLPDGGALVVNNPQLPMPPEPYAPPWSGALRWIKRQAAYALGERPGIFARCGYRVMSVAPESTSLTAPLRIDLSQASWGMSQLARRILPAMDQTHIVNARRENYVVLAQLLDGIDGISVFRRKLPDGACPWFLSILVDEPLALEAHFREQGIEGGEFWAEQHPAVDHLRFKNVSHFRRHMAALPIHQDLTFENLAQIASAVADFAHQCTNQDCAAASGNAHAN